MAWFELLGALGGAAVGQNSAACNTYRNPQSTYYGNGDRYGSSGYYDRAPNSGYYAGAYPRDPARYDDDYGRAYDNRGTAYNVTQRPGADGCTLAESPIYLPDGRVQKRFVRVCQDASGNYQVVD